MQDKKITLQKMALVLLWLSTVYICLSVYLSIQSYIHFFSESGKVMELDSLFLE